MTQRIVSTTLLSPRDAAAYLGYQPITLRVWRREGRGPAYLKQARSIRYHVRDLDAWLQAHRVEPRGPVQRDARHLGAGA